MKNIKKVLCVLLTLCMIIPMATMMISASATEFTPRVAATSGDIVFMDNFTNEATAYPSVTTSNGRVVSFWNGVQYNDPSQKGDMNLSKTDDANGYGIKMDATNAKTTGVFNLQFAANPAPFTQRDKGNGYISIHYKAVNATNEGQISRNDTDAGMQFGGNQSNLSDPLTLDIENDVWKTYTVSTAGATGGKFPMAGQFFIIRFPVLEGDGAHYVIDYVGIFDTEADAQEEATFWENYYAGTPQPYSVKADVAAGEYFAAQNVTLTSATADAKIYYTTDGSDPTTSATRAEATAAVAVSETTTIKAAAYNETSQKYSKVTEFAYTISSNKVSTPVFGGAYPGDVPAGTKVTITTETEGAKIYYTTNGNAPTTADTEYTAPIEITTANTTIKAIAVKENMENSDVAAFESKNILSKNIYWTFIGLQGGSSNGKYTAAQGVYHTDYFASLFGTNAGYVNDSEGGVQMNVDIGADKWSTLRVHYDQIPEGDSMPNANYNYMALTYKASTNLDFTFNPDHFKNNGDLSTNSQKIALEATDTYKTVIIDMHDKNEFLKNYCGQGHFAVYFFNEGSEVATASILSMGFYVTAEEAAMLKVATPNASQPSDKYSDVISVTLTSATEGASIYYTTDGTEPTKASTPYTGAITVDKNTTIKAIAVKDGCYDSQVATYTYEVTPTVATPEISLKAGKYEGNQTVTVTCATEGAKIYYTTDGTDPSATNGTLYTGPITLSDSCILKVVAVIDGKADSKVVSRTYNITGGSDNAGGSDGNTTTDTTAATTAAPTEEEKGCKSSIAIASVAMITLVSGAGVVLCRKKED